MAAFRYERELALERALTKLIRASRRALVAQERAAYWSQFGTNSKRQRSADEKYAAALVALEEAESDAQEALNHA